MVGARLGDDIDYRSGVATELGFKRVREDLEFLNRVGWRSQHKTGIENVIVGSAIQQEIVRLVAHAVDVKPSGRVTDTSAGRCVAALSADHCGWSDNSGH